MSLQDLATQYDEFIVEAHRLKEIYADKITLLVGVETEFLSEEDLNGLVGLLKKHGKNIEYLVGSVHHVREIAIDFDKETYEKALNQFRSDSGPREDARSTQMGAFLEEYFEEQYKIMTVFHPEVIGHIDLCRLYEPNLKLEDYERAWLKLRRNVKYAVGYGALFECNAAALRKGWETSYPGEDVARMIIGEGGRFTLSDDSHGPHGVALNYGRMAQYLRKLGVYELWALQRSETANAGARYTRARKTQGNWWEHPFWQRVGVVLQ